MKTFTLLFLGASATQVREVRVVANNNPLLYEDTGKLPNFIDIKPKHMRPAVLGRLEQGIDRLTDIEARLTKEPLPADASAAYDKVLLPLQQLYDGVSRPWDMLQHLKSVRDSAPLRKAVEELQPKVVAFYQKVSQSKAIFQALDGIKANDKYAALPEFRRRTVEKELLDRRLGGVGLSGDNAKEFNALEQKLSSLSTDFSNHVLDSVKIWNMTLVNKKAVGGIPMRALEAAAAAAKKTGHKDATAENGPWLLNLDSTILWPVITYATDSGLREKLFRAFTTKASYGANDNSGIITDMLKTRMRKAQLLGFTSFAELSLSQKMATSKEVHALLRELKSKGRPAAEKEDRELRTFAKSSFGADDVKLWDRSFYATKMEKYLYDIDSEALRVYFAFPAVVKGLFSFAQRLFDVEVRIDKSQPKAIWHKDVTLYTIHVNGTKRGSFLLDPYSRPGEKSAGAWMQPMITRKKHGDQLQLPVCAIVCNFPSPQAGKPALLSRSEASTVFHEFGHALQHLLTTQDEASVSGINGVEWDAVEFPSQFMEYWVGHDKTTLYSFAKHFETGEPLPEKIYAKLQESTNFMAATELLMQVYFGSIDFRLHEKYEEGEDPNAISHALAKDILVNEPLPESRFLCSFGHIFGGGYAAGYYGYQWSKVLSADAFGAFDEAGLGDHARVKALGRRFEATVLGLGGGRAPGEVFRDFRGRAPTPEALLHYSGLVP